LVGAIGVSGAASADQDNEIAEAGARAFAAAGPATVGYVPASVVGDAFTANRSVIVTPAFRVNPSSRSAPGEAEVHLWEADVMYVLNGAATLVTGGAVVAPRTIAPGEIRGERLEGGAVRRLSPGDVVHVPPGVPHWFSQVDGAFRYYVIKSSDRSAG
jgi:glc operon protein GlcG